MSLVKGAKIGDFMTAYEELLQEAEDNNIEVMEFIFRGSNKGMYSCGRAWALPHIKGQYIRLKKRF